MLSFIRGLFNRKPGIKQVAKLLLRELKKLLPDEQFVLDLEQFPGWQGQRSWHFQSSSPPGVTQISGIGPAGRSSNALTPDAVRVAQPSQHVLGRSICFRRARDAHLWGQVSRRSDASLHLSRQRAPSSYLDKSG